MKRNMEMENNSDSISISLIFWFSIELNTFVYFVKDDMELHIYLNIPEYKV
jgi:hypothetical protein